jgi:hypothetical protein
VIDLIEFSKRLFLQRQKNVKYHNIFPHLYHLNAVNASAVFLRFFTSTDIRLRLIENKDFATFNLIVSICFQKYPFFNRAFSLQSFSLNLFFCSSFIETFSLYWLLSTNNDILLPTNDRFKSIKQRYSSFLQFPHEFYTKCGLFHRKSRKRQNEPTKLNLLSSYWTTYLSNLRLSGYLLPYILFQNTHRTLPRITYKIIKAPPN